MAASALINAAHQREDQRDQRGVKFHTSKKKSRALRARFDRTQSALRASCVRLVTHSRRCAPPVCYLDHTGVAPRRLCVIGNTDPALRAVSVLRCVQTPSVRGIMIN
jgi:hypothetical protein